MIVGIKDAAKLIGISIISCCAVLVCTLFLNFTLDIADIKDQITSGPVMQFYHAQLATGKVISAVSGGCLLITSIIMLLFYIKHYIDVHRKELGILKALGYSNLKIARGFWVFGISIFIGTATGFSASFLLMPTFYSIQNKAKILPEFSIHFHPVLGLCMVILPTILFSILSVIYAYKKLETPVLDLLREKLQTSAKIKNSKKIENDNLPFIDELRKSTLKSRKTLVFFIIFASFCYSSMIQMSFSMEKLSASAMFKYMVIIIGIILSWTTLFLAITTVINSNTKTIALMRIFGYKQKLCTRAILGGYRPVAYIGFAVGTFYQYALLKIMVSVIFKEIANVPEYEFNIQAFILTLLSFVFIYEIIMYLYSEKIKKISIKEVMLD